MVFLFVIIILGYHIWFHKIQTCRKYFPFLERIDLFQKFPIWYFWTDYFDILEPYFYAAIFMERTSHYFFGIYIMMVSQHLFTNILVVYRKVNILFYHVLKKIFPDFIFWKIIKWEDFYTIFIRIFYLHKCKQKWVFGGPCRDKYHHNSL